MDASTGHLAFDLLETDLDDPSSVTALLARHAVAPARGLFGFQAPTPGEHRARMLLGGDWAVDEGSAIPTWHRDPTAADVTPLLRGIALLGATLPGVADARGRDDVYVSLPGLIIPSRAMDLALVYWDELAWVVSRALGLPAARPDDDAHLLGDGVERPSRAGIDELARARGLVERALLPAVDDPPPFIRAEAGLQAISVDAADEIDEVLVADARIRLVRITDVEGGAVGLAAYDDDAENEAFEPTEPRLVERGVVSLTLSESVIGLVALDFIETLGVGRLTGICSLCRRPFLLESQQASLARRGQPVYHPACFAERRRRYMRDYRAGRVGRGARRVGGPVL